MSGGVIAEQVLVPIWLLLWVAASIVFLHLAMDMPSTFMYYGPSLREWHRLTHLSLRSFSIPRTWAAATIVLGAVLNVNTLASGAFAPFLNWVSGPKAPAQLKRDEFDVLHGLSKFYRAIVLALGGSTYVVAFWVAISLTALAAIIMRHRKSIQRRSNHWTAQVTALVFGSLQIPFFSMFLKAYVCTDNGQGVRVLLADIEDRAVSHVTCWTSPMHILMIIAAAPAALFSAYFGAVQFSLSLESGALKSRLTMDPFVHLRIQLLQRLLLLVNFFISAYAVSRKASTETVEKIDPAQVVSTLIQFLVSLYLLGLSISVYDHPVPIPPKVDPDNISKENLLVDDEGKAHLRARVGVYSSAVLNLLMQQLHLGASVALLLAFIASTIANISDHIRNLTIALFVLEGCVGAWMVFSLAKLAYHGVLLEPKQPSFVRTIHTHASPVWSVCITPHCGAELLHGTGLIELNPTPDGPVQKFKVISGGYGDGSIKSTVGTIALQQQRPASPALWSSNAADARAEALLVLERSTEIHYTFAAESKLLFFEDPHTRVLGLHPGFYGLYTLVRASSESSASYLGFYLPDLQKQNIGDNGEQLLSVEGTPYFADHVAPAHKTTTFIEPGVSTEDSKFETLPTINTIGASDYLGVLTVSHFRWSFDSDGAVPIPMGDLDNTWTQTHRFTSRRSVRTTHSLNNDASRHIFDIELVPSGRLLGIGRVSESGLILSCPNAPTPSGEVFGRSDVLALVGCVAFEDERQGPKLTPSAFEESNHSTGKLQRFSTDALRLYTIGQGSSEEEAGTLEVRTIWPKELRGCVVFLNVVLDPTNQAHPDLVDLELEPMTNNFEVIFYNPQTRQLVGRAYSRWYRWLTPLLGTHDTCVTFNPHSSNYTLEFWKQLSIDEAKDGISPDLLESVMPVSGVWLMIISPMLESTTEEKLMKLTQDLRFPLEHPYLSRKPVEELRRSAMSPVWDYREIPQLALVAVCFQANPCVYLIDVAKQSWVAEIRSRGPWVTSLELIPNTSTLVVSDSAGNVEAWNLAEIPGMRDREWDPDFEPDYAGTQIYFVRSTQ